MPIYTRFRLILTASVLMATGFSQALFAANFYSLASGNGVWTTVGNWSNTLNGPSNGTTPNYSATAGTDNIRILSNITLTGNLTVNANTVLRIFTGNTLTINGSVDFQNGSFVTIDSGAVLLINGNLNNSNNSNGIVDNGTITVNGNLTGGNGSSIVSTNGYNGQINTTGTMLLSGTGTLFGSLADCTTGPCHTSANSPLPVELVYFRGIQSGKSVKLDWATASEINNSYFTIEKSSDGSRFSQMAMVAGNGNTSSYRYYSVSDDKPFAAVTYYRLKQVDYDGTATYSKVIAVSISSKDFEIVSAAADHDNAEIVINLTGTNTGKLQYTLSDALGTILRSGTVTGDASQNTVRIDAQALASSVYYFTLRSESQSLTRKIFY